MALFADELFRRQPWLQAVTANDTGIPASFGLGMTPWTASEARALPSRFHDPAFVPVNNGRVPADVINHIQGGRQVVDASGAIPAPADPWAAFPDAAADPFSAFPDAPAAALPAAVPAPVAVAPPGGKSDRLPFAPGVTPHPQGEVPFDPNPNPMVSQAPVDQPDPLAGMSWDDQLAHFLQAGSQAALRGVADVATSPIDLPVSLFNLTLAGLNEGGDALGLNPPIPGQENRHPDLIETAQVPGINFSASDKLAEVASLLAAKAGVPPLAPEEMSEGELAMQNPIRFGTAATTGGGLLASRAPALKAKLAPGDAKTNFADSLVAPYLNRPGAAVGRDAGAGAGAGTGFDLTEEQTDSPLLQALGALLGGVGGHTLAGGAQALARAPKAISDKLRPDINIPSNPETGGRYTKAQANLAAESMQSAASDKDVAFGNIRRNADDLAAEGVPREATPTTGLLADDTGLATFERSFRTQDGPKFIDRDKAVAGEAANRVASLRDPGANLDAVETGVKKNVKDLADDRDAAAFPLLRQAEASGAKVDAAPIATLIETKLAEAKRPPVRAALTEARKLLNKTGKDELDDSVSGLYETRKAINDVIEGRGENATGRFAQKELLEVRKALDGALTKASPEFGDYLKKYREGSEPLDDFAKGTTPHKLLNGEDPRDVAEGLLSGKWSAEKKIGEINTAIGSNAEAKRGWKAAFSEVLTRKVTNTKTSEAGNYEASFAKLASQFKDNTKILSKVYDPQEMNHLRQAHKLLGYFKNAERRATGGSDTAEKMLMMSKGEAVLGGPIGRSFELVLKHTYGDLKGGGMMRRFKLMVALLPTERYAAREIVGQAWFNPEVAAYLLGKKVRNIQAIPVNHGLRAAIAADLAGKGTESE